MASDPFLTVSARVEALATRAVRRGQELNMDPKEVLTLAHGAAVSPRAKADLDAALHLVELLESVPGMGLETDGGGRDL